MPISRLPALCVVAAAVIAVPAFAGAASEKPVVGAPGAGDPYFPRQGNGGYDVSSYRLAIDYLPSTHGLSGTAHITARTTESLSRFDLDLRPTLRATSVLVDGTAAKASQPSDRVQELVITPSKPLLAGKQFTVDVSYAGQGKQTIDPDGSLDGWIPTKDGAFVASEPQGSPTWFPVNDTPDDKATYSVSVTVPKGLAAISNGQLTSVKTASGRTTWSWHIGQPISSYLVTATVGRFDITTGTTAKGIPYLIAVDPKQEGRAATTLSKLGPIIDYFSKMYGPYPFSSAGAIIDNARRVRYALETATRPLFDRGPGAGTLSHELAHQWFGDDVTLSRWRDIWLNEGFAQFSSWLWDEHSGTETAAQHLKNLLELPASDHIWSPPPGNPGAADKIFSGSEYDRGAGTLEALREKLGDPTFFRIMRGWVQQHAYSNARVPQFISYAEQISGENLTHFFYVWLYRSGKP